MRFSQKCTERHGILLRYKHLYFPRIKGISVVAEVCAAAVLQEIRITNVQKLNLTHVISENICQKW